MLQPFIANTDFAWFEFLSSRASGGVVDEVNFWQPRATRSMKRFEPGEPVFFRLKRPRYAIAGYAFFAHFRVVDLDTAWELFSWKNGDADKVGFLERIGGYRGVDLFRADAPRAPLGCTVLRSARFWPASRWIPWSEDEGWASNIVQGKSEADPVREQQLLAAIRTDGADEPEDLRDAFRLVEADERRWVASESVVREGQGAFRLRLLDAYNGRCAITGEHTEPVLDAAHIQRYLGPQSNHPQNGMILTKEFHTLFDRGYVTVTPDHVVRVSPALRSEWQNGKRYYPYDGQKLVQLPRTEASRPSPEALDWHARHVFRRAG